MIYSRIVGTGSALPKNIVTNADLEARVDTTDEWIQSRTGIKQRHIVGPNETASTLSCQASLRALEMAGLKPNDIDFIIVATTTPDRVFPSVACDVQAALGITSECAAFDLSAACAGFGYALGVADPLIRVGRAKNILVIGVEVFSRVIDWADRSTCVLFGDGAGAVVLQASDKPGIMVTHMHADGQYADLLHVPHMWGSTPETPASPYVKMMGSEVFKLAVTKLGDLVESTLKEAGLSYDQLNWMVPHQANLRIISALAKRIALPVDRVVLTIAQHGNTSSASIPLALDVAVRDGRIQSGHYVLLDSFGAGFAWASVLLQF